MENRQVLPPLEDQAPEVKDDPTLSEVLLSRVLIEEYEALQQPKWSESAFQNLKERDVCDGETVKEIYREIYKAQSQHIAGLRKSYENKYKRWFKDEALKQIVDRALLADVSGEIDELRERLTKRFKERFPTLNGGRLHSLVEETIFEIFIDRATDATSPVDDRTAATTLRSALCLSGGGIRSATFNLGILQGLARHGLLEKFDYLSTVSGGGFIGGWLSAWKKRKGLQEVTDALRRLPKTPLDPDPKPVEHLRIYSNYLSPQPGLFSADTWTLIASLVRNLLLNWFVFVPVLMAILLLPRMWASIVLRIGSNPTAATHRAWWIGFIAAVVGLSYIALNLPSASANSFTDCRSDKRYKLKPEDKRYKVKQGPFIFGSLIWLVVSACALSVFLWKWQLLGYDPLLWRSYARFGLAIIAIPWVLFSGKVLLTAYQNRKQSPDKNQKRSLLVPLLLASGVIFVTQGIIGYIASAVLILLLPLLNDDIAYSIFSTPLVLLLMAFEAVLLTGFNSRFSHDDDQEWWARAGGWVLLVAVAWILVHSLVLYGPLLLLNLEGTVRNLSGGLRKLTWADWGKLAGTVLGVVSGVVTLFGGFSAKTPANSKEAEKSGMGGLLLALLTQVLAPVFLAFVIILLSLVTNWLLTSRPSEYFTVRFLGQHMPFPFSPYATWHHWLVAQTPIWLLLVLLLVLIVLSVICGRLISTNVFSLQYLWRNRIIRAYLGASHENRHPNRFTNFDHCDNLQMHELWPQPDAPPPTGDDPFVHKRERKLFHVLNMALNLTGGDKLQWQDRKAESFTVSPLHAGSYWLGYRRSKHYGGTDGITLGASVAISGAFVSPNMGYMMTSPVVRFLMTLFNVRFGWWLGNPGPAGERATLLERFINWPLRKIFKSPSQPFRHDSPVLSVVPFLSEATGNIDDKSTYVYLSDGGHFENLGLYEMVLRRCRFIVVCDATTDPDYSFESFATSIRQIRVDLGVPIDIPALGVGAPSQTFKNKYCARGTIRYSCVDRPPDDPNSCNEDYDGILIFIKPSLIGEEPRDVINYWQARSAFPQEVITDQWFSEAQFESYRALGSNIIDAICGDSGNRMNLAQFAEKVSDHNLLNFRAFQEEISYLALQEEFKFLISDTPVESYRAKVRKFVKTILR